MDLEHPAVVVVRAKEVPVDVGGHREYIVIIILFYLPCYLLQNAVAFMRVFLSVHLQPRAVETPEEVGSS